ncbi:MAG: tRNA (guanosine(37)-N1)-methyltransferase TrmD [Myxococcota bacterium]
MRIDIVTLFREGFDGLEAGLVGRSLERGDAGLHFLDPRSFTTDPHRSVDDQPYGGGGGMVLRVEPWAAAVAAARAQGPGPVLLLTPQGRPLDQRDLVRWSAETHLVLVCGRYEGFDERIRGLCDEQVSVGDFVLTGGEPAACCLVDGLVRLLPGTLGNASCPENDSFSSGLGGLLEHPHYTRPPEWKGQTVPEVLRSGDHAGVERWRRAQALDRTRARRPDRLAEASLDEADYVYLQAQTPPLGRGLWLAPSRWEPGLVHQLLGLQAAFGVERVFVSPDAQGPEELSRLLSGHPDLEVERVASRRKERVKETFSARDFVAVTDSGPVQGWLGPEGRWARCGAAGGSASGPVRTRRSLASAPRWVLASGQGIPEAVPRVAPVRGGRAGGAALSELWHLGLQLDRLIGEG